ncbi:MAG: multiphosphoryl transfer protein [Actinomycetota bacterium]|nr:multiphosphoryl transfer protein [Actinomycetota bacterium]
MIGIVVVSHSPRLAEAAVELALEMVPGERPRLAIAAGVDDLIGTDAARVAAAITEVASPDGVLVLVDLGSAVMSAELSLEFLAPHDFEIRITSAPFVEGLLAGVVRAAGGASLDEVEREARGALESKRGHLGDPVETVPVAEAGELSIDLRLHNSTGLHIRPASMVVMAVTPMDATVAIANLRTGSGPRVANSPTSLLTLAAQRGDVLRVSASGPQAQDALDAIRALVESGFGEADAAAAPMPEAPARIGPTRGGPLGVSPGRAVGPVVRMPDPLAAPILARRLARPARRAEAARIDEATASVAAALRARAERVSGEAREILDAAALMAVDPTVLSDARAAVLDRGESAEYAVWSTVEVLAGVFSAHGGRVAERIADLQDMRNRVVAELLGRPEPGVPVQSEPFILVARDLAPADTALLNPAVCRAIVTVEGGPTSHTAILSRSLGLPAVVSVENALDIPEGTMVLVDGTTGTVTIDPSEAEVAEVEAQVGFAVEFSGTGATRDGHRVQLLANVASPESVEAALAARAEGIGLFRTEFLFLDRAQAPTVDEQVAAYSDVFAAFAGKRVIIRTLDAGADKPLAFVTLADEANPALGIRGYRTSWRRPDLIDDQLRAISIAAKSQSANVQVMAPMIDTPDEAADFANRCAEQGLGVVGVMIETPAAAITAPELLSLVDFVSLGTNDLAQYTMAADREVGDLALLNDPWQPAVLRMMQLAFQAGAAAGKPVSVCGEAAADPLLAAVLVGFGASSLSMSPRALGHVGELLGTVSLSACRRAADAAAGARTAQAARAAAAALCV